MPVPRSALAPIVIAPLVPSVSVRVVPLKVTPAVLVMLRVDPVKTVALAASVIVCADVPPIMSVLVPVLLTIGWVVAVLVEVRLPCNVMFEVLLVVPPKPPPVLEVVDGLRLTLPVMVTLVVPLLLNDNVPPATPVPAVPPKVILLKVNPTVAPEVGALRKIALVELAKFIRKSPKVVLSAACMIELKGPDSNEIAPEPVER